MSAEILVDCPPRDEAAVYQAPALEITPLPWLSIEMAYIESGEECYLQFRSVIYNSRLFTLCSVVIGTPLPFPLEFQHSSQPYSQNCKFSVRFIPSPHLLIMGRIKGSFQPPRWISLILTTLAVPTVKGAVVGSHATQCGYGYETCPEGYVCVKDPSCKHLTNAAEVQSLRD